MSYHCLNCRGYEMGHFESAAAERTHAALLLLGSPWQDGGAYAMQTTQLACLFNIVLVASVS